VPVRWGIISTARINLKFLAGACEATGVEIAAVASRDRRRGQEFAHEHDIERVHDSYEALLGDPDIEVVYIPLPNALHIEWTMRALRAGKHVLCEKPLSRTASDVAEAFALAELAGRLLMEGFMFRHHPQTRRLGELIDEEAVGRVRMISSAFSFATNDSANIRLSSGLDGGALMDVGCYCVNASRMIGGEPQRVSAEQAIGGDGVDVAFAATMRLQNDVLAHFDAGLELAPRDLLEVVGDQGSLFLADPWHCREPVIELRRGGETERIVVEQVDPYRLQAENMSAAIRGERRLLLGREDAVGQARTIEALYASAERGSAVTLADD
jgi:D-xylose 1-dehydrogenase (NADP+, D-xylono-1,5-lactone-forming)